MTILFTGKGTSGSWVIRGWQLGRACGADMVKRADEKTLAQHTVAIVVKRITDDMLKNLRASGTPWVWDIVDAWPQPEGNTWNRDRCVRWLQKELRRLQPDGVIFATTRMQEDAQWGGVSLVLPHHANPTYCSWANTAECKFRDKVYKVCYEGAPHYLGKWANVVAEQCSKRGWKFEINGDLRTADIGVALRDYEGHAARHWKSNVKLANLQALGVPAVCSPESGYIEFGSTTEQWAVYPKDLERAFDAYSDAAYRRSVQARMLQSTITLGRVRHELLQWLKASRFF